jgi:hypothetical protein
MIFVEGPKGTLRRYEVLIHHTVENKQDELERSCNSVKFSTELQDTVLIYNQKWWCDVLPLNGRVSRLDKCEVVKEKRSWLMSKFKGGE